LKTNVENIIEHFANYPVATLTIIGILLIIAAITNGKINLGFIKIPKLEPRQAKLMGLFGGILIVTGIIVGFILVEPNNPPVALNDIKSIFKGEIIDINVTKNDRDQDNDKLTVVILNYPKIGKTSLINNEAIRYESDPESIGQYTIKYQISDGKGGADTAVVEIIVKEPPRKLVTTKLKLIDIFGREKMGEYKLYLDHKTQTITTNLNGLFKLTGPENTLCKLFIDKDTINFSLNDENELQNLEYNPIKRIKFIFCKNYDKFKEMPLSIFKNRFRIPFKDLEVVEETLNGKKVTYRRLYCGLKFYGSNSYEYSRQDQKRTLNFKFLKKNGIEYDPIAINSGTSSNGWDSNLNKKILKGEYELQVISQSGKQLFVVQFEII
jgi:Bacterial Ig domain